MTATATYVEHVMGMPISLALRGPLADQEAGRAAAGSVFDELRAVDARFSTYRGDSELSAIHAGALLLDEASAIMREVAELCSIAREVTGGSFDARFGGRFDPTGLVKGWAAERAARLLGALDGHDHCLNAAGDVTVGCRRNDTPAWRVGIEHPARAATCAAIVELRTGAVATSGIAARGHHIIDPRTGEPAASGVLSVSVAGSSLTWADVYATAAFVHGTEAVAFLEAIEGYEGLVVHADGTTAATSGWRAPAA